MKKILITLITVLLMSACSTQSQISNDATLFTINGVATKKSDYYTAMQYNDNGSVALTWAQSTLLETYFSEDYDFTEEINLYLADVKEYLGDYYETYITTNGYADEAEFIEKEIRPMAMINALLREQLETSLQEYIDQYATTLFTLVATTDYDSIVLAKETLTDSSVLETLSSTVANLSIYDYIIHSETADLPAAVTGAAAAMEVNQISDVLVDEDTATYFVIVRKELILDEHKENIINVILNETNYSNEHLSTLFETAGFKIYDSGLLEKMTENYPEYVFE